MPKAIVLLFVFASLAGHSRQQTLLQVIEISKQNYPSIRARQAEVNAADREIKASASEYIPRLTLQHQYTYATDNNVAGSFYPNAGTALSPSGGIRTDNVYKAVYGSFTTAIVEWNVFNFGKVSGSVRAAKANRESNQAAYENELFQHQIRVADAYLLLLIGKKITSIQQQNVARAKQFQNVVDAGTRSGLRPGVDSALAHAEYIKAILVQLESIRNEKAQQYRLIELTGIDAMDDTLKIDSMRFYTSLPPVLDTVDFDLKRNPVLHYYQRRIEAADARSISIRRSFYPSVSIVGAAWARGSGISNTDDSYHTDFGSGTNYQVYNYLVGLSTRWTLTDYVQVRHRYKGERFNLERDKEIYREQHLKLRRQLKESDMHYELAREQAKTAPIQLVAAQQAYQQANARYKSGLTDLPTVLQSLVTLNRAEADLAIAYSNAWRSLLMVAAAKGDLSIFLTVTTN